MGQIISWSVRDESLHCEGMIKLFHEFVKETKIMSKRLENEILGCCENVVSLEDNFIDLAFEFLYWNNNIIRFDSEFLFWNIYNVILL